MLDQHRTFFESLPYVVIGSLTPEGMPVASLLAGAPGFIRSPDLHTLIVRCRPVKGDPIAEGLRVGSPVGLLGIELYTRRRNRANGTLISRDDDSFVVHVQQSFGNCPQYIQARGMEARAPASAVEATRETARLSPRALALINAADTFFIATSSLQALPRNSAEGVDVSHRGGLPGFVETSLDGDDGRTVLTVPDYSGNNLFMTLGNLKQNPRAGLVFVNFNDGSLLSLSVTAEILWGAVPERPGRPPADRQLRFRLVRGQWVPNALPYRFTAPNFARELWHSAER